MAFPISSRNISPLLKLFHDTSTCIYQTVSLYSNAQYKLSLKNKRCEKQIVFNIGKYYLITVIALLGAIHNPLRQLWQQARRNLSKRECQRPFQRGCVEACDSSSGRHWAAGINPRHGPLIFHSAYLRRCDVFPPLDVQQSQDIVDIGVHVVKTRGHPALLVAEERAAYTTKGQVW